MFPTQQNPLRTLVGLIAGARATTMLKNAVRTVRLRITVEGDFTNTTPGTDVYNRGSILGAVDTLGISENGTDRALIDARALRHLSNCYSAGRSTDVRLTKAQAAAATATYHLRETFNLDLSLPDTASPSETGFMERDTRQALEFFATANLVPGRIMKGGVGALANVKVSVEQIYDAKVSDPLVFVPTIRQMTKVIAAANAAEQIFIRSSSYMRGIIISQDSDVGEVGDIIKAVRVLGDHRAILGESGPIPWANLVADQASQFGGATDDQNAHLFLKWYRNGRLSTVFNPAADRNLRVELDCAPSQVAGATNSTVRITILELERIKDLTVDPLPFDA